MRTRPKDLGTRHETRVVRACQDAGLIAERLAEAGVNDLGDVRIICANDQTWILECKDRQNLPIHKALDKALRKSMTPRTAVVWRRMVRREGNTNRTQEGPVVVALTLEAFIELLGGTE